MSDFDAIVIGAGHNGLVAAAYLAQAGQRVCVLEKQSRVGGAVATEEVVPGYRFDLGGSAHILIRLTPIAEELRLADYGLDYIDLDPLFFAPFEDGDALFIHRDLDRTVADIEARFPSQGVAYRRFCERWTPFARMVRDSFLDSPGPLQLGRRFGLNRAMRSDWQRALGEIMQPYGDLAAQYFSEEKLLAPLVWMAAQSGPPPFEPMGAPFLLWQPLYHEGGIARPRGGSGMLTQALRRHIEAHGGVVETDTPVESIDVRGRRAVGVRAMGGTYSARAVIAACHAQDTFGRLLPPEHRPPAAAGMRIGNGFGAVLRLALDSPVRYSAHAGDEARQGLQLLCRSRAQIDAAYADYLRGEPASDPPIVAMTFSAVDDSLAPPGGEVLWLWAQYYPYRLAHGTWDDIGEGVADRILDTFEHYAPGTRAKVVGRLFQHPLWLERELGLHHGNVMHLEMNVAQMFALRPFAGMSGYRTHLDGLFLTGASTHPGGGIMGASGRNAARVVLKSLERRWFRRGG
ncbi:MAG: NAD(P)/FAD-dependent oxidoreductase [Gemmatimonadetes bacterium]|nr:NAD(P)/FAD-dependent oxidoreductase [Gemmatimonadota bacterium]